MIEASGPLMDDSVSILSNDECRGARTALKRARLDYIKTRHPVQEKWDGGGGFAPRPAAWLLGRMENTGGGKPLALGYDGRGGGLCGAGATRWRPYGMIV